MLFSYHIIIWAHSLKDRISGFGPVGGGSIPPVPIHDFGEIILS